MILLSLLLACGAPTPTAPARVDPDKKVEVPITAEHTIRVGGGLRYMELRTSGTTDDSPVVLALHGRGSNPEHFAGWLQHSDGGLRLLMPYGTKDLGHGLGWLETPINGPEASIVKELDTQVDRLAAWLEQVHPEPVVALGWSQGGMLAAGLAIRYPERISEAWVGGVRLPLPLIDAATPASAPIHAVHGTKDDVVPLVDTRSSIERLTGKGVVATFEPIEDGDHRFQGSAFASRFAQIGVRPRDESAKMPAETRGPDEPWDGKTLKPGPDGVPNGG